MSSTWLQRCIFNQGFLMALMFIIFRNIIQGLWLRFFLNTKIFSSREFLSHNFFFQKLHYLGHLTRSKAQQKVYRLLQRMESNQPLLKWLASNFISKKSDKFEFFNPKTHILVSLPPPPRPSSRILLG